MEAFSTSRSFTRYWKRRGYERLSRPPPIRKAARRSPTGARRRRRWQLKIGLKIRRLGSPKKWLTRLRDAYLNTILRFANAGLGATSLDSRFGRNPVKEYDQQMIVEIYASLVTAQAQVLPRDASDLAPHLVSCGP